MTHQKLSHLFMVAKNAPSNTSVEEVTKWVGVAATTAGALGIAAKLKLFISKKAIIMLGSTFGTIGIVAVSVALIGSSPASETQTSSSETVKSAINQPSTPEVENVHLVFDEDKNKMAAEKETEASELPKLSLLEIESIQNSRDASLAPVDKKSSCLVYDDIEGNGKVVKQERTIMPFGKLETSGIFDVIVMQGDKEAVYVETDENLQELILVENEGEKLILSSKNDRKIKKSTKMIVHVTVTNLSLLELSGIGDVSSSGALNFNEFTLEVNGVGDANLDLTCAVFLLEHSGVGDVNLKGKCDDAHIEYEGVGKINAYEFTVKELMVEHSGVGSANVYASDKLIVDASGVGSVRYKGNPGTKKIIKNGIGSVKSI